MARVSDTDLLYISKGVKERLDTLAAGERLINATGYSIDKLRRKTVEDRLQLAKAILKGAESAYNSSTPSYRSAVSRAYYSMYHTIRALSFYVNGGDDHQDHSKLPAKIPDDFPSRAQWENDLKHARFQRNRADYDPYPRNDRRFQGDAKHLIALARNLTPEVRKYLRGKGWKP